MNSLNDIRFRAMIINSTEWVYGYYVYMESYKQPRIWSHRIYTGYAETDVGDFYPNSHEINPNTLCRYIGMKDVNDEMIYEHDLVEVEIDLSDGTAIKGTAEVVWDADFLRWSLDYNWAEDTPDIVHLTSTCDLRVVGNVMERRNR